MSIQDVFWPQIAQDREAGKWFDKAIENDLRKGDLLQAMRDLTQVMFMKARRFVADACTDAALPAYTVSGNVLEASANGALTVDNVALANGELLLVTEETNAQYNGLYTVAQAGDGGNPYILERAAAMNTSDELIPGTTIVIERGATLGGKWFVLSSGRPLQINLSPLTFTEVAPVGVGEIYTMHFVTKGGDTRDYEFGLPEGTWSMVDSFVHARAAGTTSDTFQWFNGLDALSDAIAVSGMSAHGMARIGTIQTAVNELVSGSNVLIGRETDGGGDNDNPILDVTVMLYRAE